MTDTGEGFALIPTVAVEFPMNFSHLTKFPGPGGNPLPPGPNFEKNVAFLMSRRKSRRFSSL